MQVGTGSTGGLFTDVAPAMNAERDKAQTAFGTPVKRPPFNKVLIIVFDGLRWDHVLKLKNSSMDSFSKDEDSFFSEDGVLFKMRAQLPTMSVPNWVTLVTGANPELTGVLGNLMIPDTPLDSVFRRAKLAGFRRGLSGSPWFGEIVESQLTRPQGYGTVPTSFEQHSPNSADQADWKRLNITTEALNDTKPFDLWLVHFSDIDGQGHCCGVTTEWNSADSYNGAIKNKSIALSTLMNSVDNQTVIIGVSDHGHVDRGGHGGTDNVLEDVPLFFWKRHSGLSKTVTDYKGPTFSAPIPHEYLNTDVAGTITALLGIPAPAHTKGRLVEKVVLSLVPGQLEQTRMLRDLWEQKREFTKHFLLKLEGSSSAMPETCAEAGVLVPCTPASVSVTQPNAKWMVAIDELVELVKTKRMNAYRSDLVRNRLLAALLSLVILSFSGFITRTKTMCLLRWNMFSTSADTPIEHLSCRINKNAFWLAGLATVVYMGASLGCFIILYNIYGYTIVDWESTMIHTPAVLGTFLLYVFLVPCALLLLKVGLKMLTLHLATTRGWQKLPESTDFKHPLAVSTAFDYLHTQYSCFWVVLVHCILFVLQGNYVVFTPVFMIRWLEEAEWRDRFRILCVQFMSIPLTFQLLYHLNSSPGQADMRTNSSQMDMLYELGALKKKRIFAKKGIMDTGEHDILSKNRGWEYIDGAEVTTFFDTVDTTPGRRLPAALHN